MTQVYRFVGYVFLLGFVLFYPQASHAEVSAQESFFTGNNLLMQGKYEEAASHYQDLLNQGIDNAAVHYNLGIASYRQGSVGKAIFHFYSAHLLKPRDADIAFNLNFARKFAKDKIEPSKKGFVSTVVEKYPFSKRESLYLVGALAVLCTIFGAILLFRPREGVRWAQRCLLVLLSIAFVGGLIQWQGSPEFGVIVSPQAEVYSGQGAGSVLLFSLHEGTEFTVHDRANEWLRIRLADGKQGWIKEQQVLVTASGES